MQRLEVSGAVRLIYRSLGVKGLTPLPPTTTWFDVSLRTGPLLFYFYLAVLSERFCGFISLHARAYQLDFHVKRNTITNLDRFKI